MGLTLKLYQIRKLLETGLMYTNATSIRLTAEKHSRFNCKLLLEFLIMSNIFIDVSIDRNKI